MCEDNERESQTRFRVPEENIDPLLKQLDKLGRRAKKLGLTPPSLKTLGQEDVPLMTDPRDRSRLMEVPPNRCEAIDPKDIRGYRRYFMVELAGEAPTVPGWELLGVLEHGDSDLGNVIRHVPGKSVPADYRQVAGLCQHCGYVRRRLETFVLRDAEGTLKQIGRNCLADHLRDPKAATHMASAAEILYQASGLCGAAEDGEEGFGGGGWRSRRVSALSLLNVTAAVVKAIGWLSRSKARDSFEPVTATADWVRDLLLVPEQSWTTPVKELDKKLKKVEVEEGFAEAALEWVRAMRPQAETLDDYLHNLLVVLSDETVDQKHFGIACSAVAAYQRHLRGLKEEELVAQRRKANRHLGTLKKREVFEVEVLSLREFDGDYGVRVLVDMADPEGNRLNWWTGSGCPLAEGKKYKLKATVTKHDEYKGWPKTVVNRCVVVEELAATAAEEAVT